MVEVGFATRDAGAHLVRGAGDGDRVDHLVGDAGDHRLAVALGERRPDSGRIIGEAAGLEHRRVRLRRGVEGDLGRHLPTRELLVFVDRAQEHADDLDLRRVASGPLRTPRDSGPDDLVDVPRAERGVTDQAVGHPSGGLDHASVHAGGVDRDPVPDGREYVGGRAEVHRVEATLVLDRALVELPDAPQ